MIPPVHGGVEPLNIEDCEVKPTRFKAVTPEVLDRLFPHTRIGNILPKGRSEAVAPARQPVPSVGRVVHYKSYGTPGGEYETLPRAAIITEVEEPGQPGGNVGLCVLNPTGQFFNRHVPYGEGPGCWSWPPFVPTILSPC